MSTSATDKQNPKNKSCSRIDCIRFPSIFGRSIRESILVVGPRGSGKSALFKAFFSEDRDLATAIAGLDAEDPNTGSPIRFLAVESRVSCWHGFSRYPSAREVGAFGRSREEDLAHHAGPTAGGSARWAGAGRAAANAATGCRGCRRASPNVRNAPNEPHRRLGRVGGAITARGFPNLRGLRGT